MLAHPQGQWARLLLCCMPFSVPRLGDVSAAVMLQGRIRDLLGELQKAEECNQALGAAAAADADTSRVLGEKVAECEVCVALLVAVRPRASE